MGGLPEGWAWARLGDVAQWGSGGTPKAKAPDYYGGTIPWAVIGDMDDGVLRETAQTITDAGLAASAAKWIPEGAILVAMYGSIGKLAIAGIPITSNQAIAHAVPFREVLDAKYLFWYLRSQRERLISSGKGGTQQNISQSVLKQWPIPVPPLAEQHRIVEALEEQLSRLDAAAASVEQGLRRSQALLRAVVDSALCSVSDSPKMLLGNVLSEPLRNGHSAKATIDPNGVRTLSLTAVTNGDFSDANTKLTVADRDRVKGLWLEPQDLLIQRSNTPELVGTAALFTGARNWAIFPDLLIRVRLNPRVMPEYALLELQSKRGRSYFRSRAKGLAGSMPKIDQAAIEGFEISVPALEVQKRIVQRVADERERISRLAAELSKARRRAGGLRNGLLRKAFSGGLVAQDPADEPAATLLDRIAAEREAAKPARKPTARPRKATAAGAKAAPAPTPAPSASVQQELFVQ
ncbi:restriction endonuclease subunit S [Streptomyces sp. NPDC002589]|uniref:restriction endonuclease subunit S n=1 Tax=Streptomyces sp. NPDC002589 TaxID=3154420 RepID=UPI003325C4D1